MQFQELKSKKISLSLNLDPQTKMKSDIETQGPLGICVIKFIPGAEVESL